MDRFNRTLRFLFFLLFIQPLAKIITGLNARHMERLPKDGPAIIVANHNSHMDTVVLMSLFPLSLTHKLRPIAAADYFLRGKLLSWFALHIIKIVPINRKRVHGQDPLAPITEALKNKDIIIFFPEGTRGDPERMGNFKKGIAHLAERNPSVPVVPIFIQGAGKVLPRGEALIVPFFCDVFVGESLYWTGDRNQFVEKVHDSIIELSKECPGAENEKDDVFF